MAEENKAEQKSSAKADAQEKLESSRTHARKAAEDLRAAAGAIAGEYRGKAEQAWGEARDRAEEAWADARDRVRTFQEDAEQYVRENPTKAVLPAIESGARAIAGAGKLFDPRADTFCVRVWLPGRKHGCRTGACRRDFLVMDRARSCRPALRDCAGLAPDRPQPNDQAALSRHGIGI